MAKYAEPATSIKIRACYESIPAQLAKENHKFQYSVVQKGIDVIPVEVKAGVRIRSKSLGVFLGNYTCPYSIRISKKNFGFENGIKSVPLYAVFCI